MTVKKTTKAKKAKKPSSKTSPPEKQKRKSLLLDLVVKRSSGVDDVYLLDVVDLGGIGILPGKFIEIPTTKTPGIRFITLRKHDGQ